ncbi:hypothetical protein ES703_55851 [subsurface metagenome]
MVVGGLSLDVALRFLSNSGKSNMFTLNPFSPRSTAVVIPPLP